MTDTAYVIMCYTPGDEPEIFSDVDSVALTLEAAKREVAERTAALRAGSQSYYMAIGVGVVDDPAPDPTVDEERRKRIVVTDGAYAGLLQDVEQIHNLADRELRLERSGTEWTLRQLSRCVGELRAELKGLGY